MSAARRAGIDVKTLEEALPDIMQLPEMPPPPPPPPPLTEQEKLQRLQALQSRASKLKVLKAGAAMRLSSSAPTPETHRAGAW